MDLRLIIERKLTAVEQRWESCRLHSSKLLGYDCEKLIYEELTIEIAVDDVVVCLRLPIDCYIIQIMGYFQPLWDTYRANRAGYMGC
jgi:hypothetical protein